MRDLSLMEDHFTPVVLLHTVKHISEEVRLSVKDHLLVRFGMTFCHKFHLRSWSEIRLKSIYNMFFWQVSLTAIFSFGQKVGKHTIFRSEEIAGHGNLWLADTLNMMSDSSNSMAATGWRAAVNSLDDLSWSQWPGIEWRTGLVTCKISRKATETVVAP